MPVGVGVPAVFVIAMRGAVARTLQFAGRGRTAQSGGALALSYAMLLIATTPFGIGFATVTTTVSARLPPAGTVRPFQVTTPPPKTPPLLAETNATFASSGSVMSTFVTSLPPAFERRIV